MAKASSAGPARGRSLFLSVLVALGLAAVVYVNYRSNAEPFCGITIAFRSRVYSTLITPASYAFGIWGLIYALLAGFAAWQFGTREVALRRIQLPALLNFAANIAWIIAFSCTLMIVQAFLMLVLFGTLLRINIVLFKAGAPASATDRWLIWLPWRLYFAWVLLAAMVSMAIFRKSEDFNYGPAQNWAIFILLVAFGLVSLSALRLRSWAIPLGAAWGFAAIAVNQWATGAHAWVAALAATASLVLLVWVVAFLRVRTP